MFESWLLADISRHIEPNPCVYVRLARVSRLFESIFLSDALWSRLDPHGGAKNVAQLVGARLNELSVAQRADFVSAWSGNPIEYAPNSLDLQLAFYVRAAGQGPQGPQGPPIEDFGLAYCAVDLNPQCLQSCSPKLQLDRRLILRAVRRDPAVFEHCCKEARSDREIVLEVVKQAGSLLHLASKELRADRQVVLAACSSYDNKNDMFYPNWCPLTCLDGEMLEDREVLRVSAERNSWAVQYFPEPLKSDRELMLPPLYRHPLAGRFAHPSIKFNPEILAGGLWACNAVELQTIMASIPQELRHDREFFKRVVKGQGRAYGYIGNSLRSDREIIHAAVAHWGPALQYARSEFANDREIVLAAVRNDGTALAFASSALKKDREVVCEAVRQSGLALRYAFAFKADRDLALAAVRQNGSALEFARAFQDDAEVVLAAVGQARASLEFASARLQQQLQEIN